MAKKRLRAPSVGLLRCSPVCLLPQLGVNGAFASRLPRSRLTPHTLALSTGNDLNSVAIFEEAGGWHTERGAKDARQVRRVGEACRVSSLGEGSPTRTDANGGQQVLPAQIALNRHFHLAAKEVAKSIGREMDACGEGRDRLGLLNKEVGPG
jgi:hypothetical protein